MDTALTWQPAPWATRDTETNLPRGARREKAVIEKATLTGVVPEERSFEQMSDDALVTQVSEGSHRALETLYDRHVRGCFGLSLKIVRDPSIAEEVVQDVFTKLWTSPDSFKPERGKFSGWLLTLVHNRSVDKLRRLKANGGANQVSLDGTGDYEGSPAATVADPHPGPAQEAWRHERGQIVRRALLRLPEAQRQTLSLAYFGGLTQREIAEHLDQPLGTVKTRTRTALQALQRLLKGQDLFGEVE